MSLLKWNCSKATQLWLGCKLLVNRCSCYMFQIWMLIVCLQSTILQLCIWSSDGQCVRWCNDFTARMSLGVVRWHHDLKRAHRSILRSLGDLKSHMWYNAYSSMVLFCKWVSVKWRDTWFSLGTCIQSGTDDKSWQWWGAALLRNVFLKCTFLLHCDSSISTQGQKGASAVWSQWSARLCYPV